MTWVKLDDNFTDNPKIDALSDAAFRLHVSGLCYSARHLTDGHIPRAVLSKLTPHARPGLSASELASKGVWIAKQDGWEIHDYLDFQETAAEVKARRKKDAERKRSERQKRDLPAETSPVSERTSKRTPSGLQADSPSGVRVPVPADVQPESRHPDPTRPTDVNTPSLTHSLEAPQAEGGSGSAAEPNPEPTGMRAVDDLLRKVCPPDKNRLFGAPRTDLQTALRQGADPDLILAAIRQGDPNEGAFIRAGRATRAAKEGKLDEADRGLVLNEEGAERARGIVQEPPPDPEVFLGGLAEARAALGR